MLAGKTDGLFQIIQAGHGPLRVGRRTEEKKCAAFQILRRYALQIGQKPIFFCRRQIDRIGAAHDSRTLIDLIEGVRHENRGPHAVLFTGYAKIAGHI